MSKEPKTTTGEMLEMPAFKLGKGTVTFRTLLIVLLLSMHPIGQAVLIQLGFQLPKSEPVSSVKAEIEEVKTKVDVLSARVERLDQRFAQFEFSFSRVPTKTP